MYLFNHFAVSLELKKKEKKYQNKKKIETALEILVISSTSNLSPLVYTTILKVLIPKQVIKSVL